MNKLNIMLIKMTRAVFVKIKRMSLLPILYADNFYFYFYSDIKN